MIDLEKETERVILVGVSVTDEDDTQKSLEELKDLASTAGADTVGVVIQNREQVHPGTYVGKGKIEEIKDLLWELEATGIICDDELSPAQMKNLQDELDAKVMDRTLVILDIFASRASTSEGKIQVELAQLKVPSVQAYRIWHGAFQAGRRHRYQRAGREETGDGPKADQGTDCPAEPGIERREASPGGHKRAEKPQPDSGGGHRRVYQCRKVYAS